MGAIRVVSGTGTGPTTTAAYDAALLSAGVGNYNLVSVSSVVPPGATVEVDGTAPDLGAAGDRLTVVQARAVGDRVAAALSWARGDDGRGLFYEGTVQGPGPEVDDEELRERALREAERGLTAGFDRRDWTPAGRSSVAVAESVPASDTDAGGQADAGADTETDTGTDVDADTGADTDVDADADAGERDRHAAAVVLAVYGDGTALV
ncbi:pyruvoyl-dependent arginine decarboxylase [Halobacteriales archaeon SW_7_71_33]|nr:MAG: pyruvoyl-dependent arginine decarboxylase [Halobacteriales archaeon SW_7_71_33]